MEKCLQAGGEGEEEEEEEEQSQSSTLQHQDVHL